MTDIEMSEGSMLEFSLYLLGFWGVFIALFAVCYYTAPYIKEAYWRSAYVLYWVIRRFIRTTRGHDRSRYTGY